MKEKTMHWTGELVRQKLPNFKVKLGNGKIVEGRLEGQDCLFPQVWIVLEQTNLSIGTVGWDAVASCLNHDCPMAA